MLISICVSLLENPTYHRSHESSFPHAGTCPWHSKASPAHNLWTGYSQLHRHKWEEGRFLSFLLDPSTVGLINSLPRHLRNIFQTPLKLRVNTFSRRTKDVVLSGHRSAISFWSPKSYSRNICEFGIQINNMPRFSWFKSNIPTNVFNWVKLILQESEHYSSCDFLNSRTSELKCGLRSKLLVNW